MTIIEQTGMLSNYWWAVIASDYSVSIFLIGSFVIALLQCLAILIPGVKTNSIIGLFRGWIYGFPGMKQETSTTTTASESSAATTTTTTEIKTDTPPADDVKIDAVTKENETKTT